MPDQISKDLYDSNIYKLNKQNKMITQSSKSGLTYFPLPIIFIFNRPLRRIMKKEGDGAMAILLNAITMIYSDNGYYVKVNDLFYEDISANLFQHDVDEVVRVIELAVRFGMFDQQMFEKHSILTSDDIQRQFLFCTRRRAISTIEPQYLLLDEKELPNKDKIKADVKKRMARRKEINPTKDNAISVTDNPVFVTDNAISVTDNPVSVTDSAISVTDNTQIKEKEIKENQSKENITPQAHPIDRKSAV